MFFKSMISNLYIMEYIDYLIKWLEEEIQGLHEEPRIR
jgi:hypothetical protein